MKEEKHGEIRYKIMIDNLTFTDFELQNLLYLDTIRQQVGLHGKEDIKKELLKMMA